MWNLYSFIYYETAKQLHLKISINRNGEPPFWINWLPLICSSNISYDRYYLCEYVTAKAAFYNGKLGIWRIADQILDKSANDT